MSRILVTAFEPYDNWHRNSSWLALVELTKDLPTYPPITTRLYPVDYQLLIDRLESDLTDEFSHVVHLGQAPGSSSLALEKLGVNVASRIGAQGIEYGPLVPNGPDAYQTQVDLARLADLLRQAGIPCTLSHHAGTYLCNAALYYSNHLIRQRQLNCHAMFVHLPLDVSQAAESKTPIPSLPSSVCAKGLRLLLDELTRSDRV
ncbi:MAG: pyroglutamyl-peptidase I [Planctomycetales bacterium]|nr:pyroglutamyl-peptidase I [Planctomycetales bacterium]